MNYVHPELSGCNSFFLNESRGFYTSIFDFGAHVDLAQNQQNNLPAAKRLENFLKH